MPRELLTSKKATDAEVEAAAIAVGKYGLVTTDIVSARVGNISKSTVAQKLRRLGWTRITTGPNINSWIKK